METDLMITLGFCQSVHGLKGALKLNLENFEGRTLEKGKKVQLFPINGKGNLPKSGKEYTVSKVVYGHKVMITFEGIEDRSRAESIIPFELKVSRESLPILPEDEVYLSDLMGQDIFDHYTGEHLGKMEGFYDHPGQSVAVLKMKEKGLLEVPFVKPFFPVVEGQEEGYRIEIIVPEVI